jgi:hypothetical protein
MPEVIGLWLALAVVGLVMGMAGYAEFENMLLADADAYVNAVMVLSDRRDHRFLRSKEIEAHEAGMITAIAVGALLLIYGRSHDVVRSAYDDGYED